MLRRWILSLRILGLLFLSVALLNAACASEPDYNADQLILATTTSLNDSGLLDQLVPIFEEETGVSVKIIAVGTGAALRMGVEGNADILLTHAPDSERELLIAGDVSSRTLVAYNDFVIVGPRHDPAAVTGLSDAAVALANVRASCLGGICEFASRGDDSGTHKKELSLWAAVDIAPSELDEDWYLEVGQGMSATLTVANQRDAYTLTDRGTYLSLSDNLPNLMPVVEGDSRLLNYYSVLPVSGSKGRINALAARAFRDFLLREDVQAMIDNYLVEEYGRPLFIAAAGDSESAIAARGGAPR